MKSYIGIFDSGVGGLTVVKEILKKLPNENILYFGDTARIPYGSKSPEEILVIVREIIDWMLCYNVKAIAMACNTSSALALEQVQKEYNLPIFGMIKPTSKHIFKNDKKIKKIGVIATEATVKSKAYSNTIKKYSPHIEVTEIACPGLVEIIESGQAESIQSYKEVKKFIDPLLENNVDKIILGCTHYPYLTNVIKNVAGRSDILLNPAEFMVDEIKQGLATLNISSPFDPSPINNFYVSKDKNQFIDVGNRLLPEVFSNFNVHLEVPETSLKQMRAVS